MDFPDYYGVLGLPRFYPTQEEIRDAFLKKVVELNASGNASPDARQALDSAYVTLSDAKRKREYDEVLDRYVQAEKDSDSRKQEQTEVVAVHYLQAKGDFEGDSPPVIAIRYDWNSPDRKKRCWSVDPQSDEVYDFLFQKAEQLYQIIRKYPFQSEMELDFNGVAERSMLFLYNSFSEVYAEDYTEEEMQAIMAHGFLLLTLYPPAKDSLSPYCPISYSDEKYHRILSDFMGIANELIRAAQIAAFMNNSLFYAIASIYIVHVFNRDSILQKAKDPNFESAYQAMKIELRDFWERFHMEKEPVT